MPVVAVPEGKTAGIVNCGSVYVACRRTTKAVEKAVATAGWKSVTVEAPSFTPQGLSTPIEKLVTRNVDVIIVVGGPDAARPVAMGKAKAAGIPVSCVFCGNAGAAPIAAPAAANADADYAAQGRAAAALIISRSNGHARVAILDNSVSAAVIARQKAARAYLRRCADCKVVVSGEPTAGGDPVKAARDLVGAWLARFPKGQLDYVLIGTDSQATGPSQAITGAARKDVKIVGYDCELPALQQIRTGGNEVACVNGPLVQQAWAAVDQAIRILGGGEGKNVFTPSAVVTRANAPASGRYVETFDVVKFYSGLWKRG